MTTDDLTINKCTFCGKGFEQNRNRDKKYCSTSCVSKVEYRKNKIRKQMYAKKYFQEHKEEFKERYKKFNKLNPNKSKEYTKKWRDNHLKRCKELRKKAYDSDPERYKKYQLNYKNKYPERYKQNKKKANFKTRLKHKEKYAQQIKEWKNNNKEWINNYTRNKYHSDKQFQISGRLRRRVRRAFNFYIEKGIIFNSKDLGINYSKIIGHLKPFPKNLKDYHIDHIIPLKHFDLTNKEDIKKAFAPENHQWLLASINMSKKDKLITVPNHS